VRLSLRSVEVEIAGHGSAGHTIFAALLDAVLGGWRGPSSWAGGRRRARDGA